MTGFATLKGQMPGWSWVWDMRAVNARGLDIRLRLPDWLEGLEPAARAAVSKAISRGSVSLSLKLSKDESDTDEAIDEAALVGLLAQLKTVAQAAEKAGLKTQDATPLEILSARGVLSFETGNDDPVPIVKTLTAELPQLLAAFAEMRATEGLALADILTGQLSKIADLTERAGEIAEARRDQWTAKLQDNMARALENSDGVDPQRLAQEIAVIVVKNDVTEEIDRLRAHVKAARDLLAAKEPVGRKLDFLSQEFNREANTLCSKAQATELTAVGLDLKATIDQMREQIQNVE